MKLAITIITRGRPLGLTGVVMSLWRLRTGKHDLEFFIGCDEDDPETVVAAEILKEEVPVQICIGPRPTARGEAENRTLQFVRDVDAVTMLTDRTFCITPGWDEAIARAVTEQPRRPLWWSCPEDKVCVMPIVPRAWLEVCDHKWSPEIFPFWFDDTWNQHIDLMINGMPSLKVHVSYSGVRAETTRARDFAFWIDVFHMTFPARLEQARKMAALLGQEFVSRPDVSTYFEKHNQILSAKSSDMEKAFGDSALPGPEYLAAKARAEKYLAENMVA